MESFKYYMPTKIIFGEGCIRDNAIALVLGKTALIVTGKSSAKNGALDDVTYVLKEAGVKYFLFDETEENPSLEMVDSTSDRFKDNGIDFIVAIGGGSPLDAAKAIGVLLYNPSITASNLNDAEAAQLSSYPIAAVPTTAGTGSEVTPYAVLTLHNQRTKASMKPQVFPEAAFLDARYTAHMPREIAVNTAVDALCHLVESCLSTRSTFMSNQIAEKGLEIFSVCSKALQTGDFTDEVREKLLLMSAMAGMAIAQTGTSMPHMLGYALTYFKNIPHGRATAMTLAAYMKRYAANKNGKSKVDAILKLMQMESVSELDKYLREVLCENETFTDEDVVLYSDICSEKQEKWFVDPFGVTYDDIVEMYRESLNIYV